MGCTTGAGARLSVVSIGIGFAVSFASAQQMDGLRLQRSTLTGTTVMLAAERGGTLPMPGVVAGGRIDPLDVLAAHGRHFGITNPQTELAAGRIRRDSLDHTHSSFQQVHGQVPVFSGVVRVHQDQQGRPYAINGRFYSIDPNVPTIPQVDAAAAGRAAIAALETIAPEVLQSELTVVDPGWYGDRPLGPRLAWHIVVHDSPAEQHEAFFVDAISGKILDQWSDFHMVKDRRVHDGQLHWELPGLLVRSEGDPPVPKNADANFGYNYLGDTYDYFFRAFGRDSIDDDGMPLVLTVNSTAITCPNAAWNERVRQSFFCPGTVADDIVAHEVVHGITGRTAALIYQNQPGQLNESFSDVFGELVDLFNGDAAFLDEQGPQPSWPTHESGPGSDYPNLRRQGACYFNEGYSEGYRWFMGEDAWAFGGAIRDMWLPPCFGMPDRANHPLQLCQSYDNGGVHSGSSVPNRAFSLLTDGGTFNGFTVRGIGPIKSGAVWHRALTHYVTAAANFEDAYYDFNQSAADLIGHIPNDPRTGMASAEPFTEDDALQVDLALRATEMNTAGRCGLAFPVLDSQPPPTCGNKTVLYADGFESGGAGWTVSNSNPTTPYDWVIVSDLPNDRPGSAFFANDPLIGNCFDVDESGLHSLMSPPILIPPTEQHPMLSFIHHMAAESGYDGGNVKVRVDGGDWIPVPSDAFLFNSYNTILVLNSQFSANPLAGQDAWTHAGGRWGTSVISLTGLAQPGEHLQVRFDFGKDQCDGVEGWFVDDVEVFLCPDCNHNGVVDMQEARTAVTLAPVDSVGINNPGVFSLPSLQPAAGDVTITVTAIADLGSIHEEFGIHINGTEVGRVFEYDRGRDCPREADFASIVVPADAFNALMDFSGQNQIELTGTYEIDDHLCGQVGFVRVMLDYLPLASDHDGNQIPDECENCSTAATPLPESQAVVKSRYISFVPNNTGRWTAIRVAGLLPSAPLNDWKVLWVDSPWRVIEKENGTIEALARLSCKPVFRDWSSYSMVHVGDRVIVPRGFYRVQEIDLACVPPDGPPPAQPFGGLNLSTSLNVSTTAILGDVIGLGPAAPPDAQITVLDLGAAVDVLAHRPNALDMARADLSPADPDGWVNIIDVGWIIDTWKGKPYPFQTEKLCP